MSKQILLKPSVKSLKLHQKATEKCHQTPLFNKYTPRLAFLTPNGLRVSGVRCALRKRSILLRNHNNYEVGSVIVSASNVLCCFNCSSKHNNTCIYIIIGDHGVMFSLVTMVSWRKRSWCETKEIIYDFHYIFSWIWGNYFPLIHNL